MIERAGGSDAETQQDPLRSLAVLVVNYASHDLVEQNLKRSLGDDFPGQVIIADNYSGEAERAAIAAVASRGGWTLLPLEDNEGFGRANNLAAEHALRHGATELLLLNPDAWLDIDTVRALHSQVREDPNLQLAPTVLRPNGTLYSGEVDLHLGIGEMRSRSRRPDGTPPDSIHTWVSGACFALSAQLWRRIGGFDDDFFLYWEDVDFSRRVILAGGAVRADAGLRAVHDEGSTHGHVKSGPEKSPIYYRFNARNRLIYATKHLSDEHRRSWLRSTPRASFRIVLQGGKRQLIRPWRNLWPALVGSWEGARYLRRASRGPAPDAVPATPLRVMQSFETILPTTNPYITMLDEALTRADGVDHLRFSWRTALLGRYDAFHWHWPEAKLTGATWWRSAAKFALMTALLARHRLSRRIAVVRTAHNIELPDDTVARLWLLRRIQNRTDYWITLNSTTPLPVGAPHSVILHGHYRSWYGRYPQADRVPGRLGTFGGIRRYKGTTSLLDAYAAAIRVEPSLTLQVGGKPSSPEIAEEMQTRAQSLPGFSLRLGFLSDAELTRLATSSELIVLAYRFMHNSGSALAALSLDRPVLVPRNAANEALAAEVGPQWVQMYDDELDGATLVEAWRSIVGLTGSPDLSRREWDRTGDAHAAAFLAAVTRKRGGPRD